MGKKHKTHSLSIRFPEGMSRNRHVHLIHGTPDPEKPEENQTRFEIEAQFKTLNDQIKKSIQEICLQFSDSKNASSIVFAKSADEMIPDVRNVVEYLRKSHLPHDRYRAVLDLVGGKKGIDFSLGDNTNLLDEVSHLVGVSHSHRFEIHGALGVTDTTIYANLKLDTAFIILHDIALDIYFFHHFFDRHLGEHPSVEVLKDISTCKVTFAKERQLSFYGKPITDFKNGDKLDYISFAASCRESLSKESKFDAGAYYQLWETFFSAFLSMRSHQETRLRQNVLSDTLIDGLARYICSAPRIGGQLSMKRLKQEIRQLLLFLDSQRASNRSRPKIFFVATTVRPSGSKRRREIAALFHSTTWRRNRWRLIVNPSVEMLKRLLPYIQILKLNAP